MWTNYDIETYFKHAVDKSELAQSINGVVKKGDRPADSTKEDITIKVLSNSGCGQTQRAYVNINVYVPNLYNGKTKQWEKKSSRLGELSKLSEFLFHVHGDGLKVKPEYCTQSEVPNSVESQNGQGDWFVNNRLYIEINNE